MKGGKSQTSGETVLTYFTSRRLSKHVPPLVPVGSNNTGVTRDQSI